MTTTLIDIDGVLVDFTSKYLELLHDQTGRKHTVEEVTAFAFHACICSKHEDMLIWEHIADTPGLVRNLPTYPGALEQLIELRKRGRVVACTSPASSRWTAERVDWLRFVAGFRREDIVIAVDKSLVHGDMLIDDAQHNLEGWSKTHPYGRAVMLSRPWNASFEWADRVSSLGELV